jgi:hypothetical protein
MESTSKKHVEVEDKEILIKSSNGYMAIIPKNMAPWVREHIESGNHHIVDGYVKGLQEMKDGGKAQDGGKMKPPVKAIAEPSTTQVQKPINQKLNIGGQIEQPKAPLPNMVDLAKKTYSRYSNDGQDRTLLGVASNFIPYYEQFVDVKDIITGAVNKDKEKMNSGTLGMAAPVAGKAVLSGMDYMTEKILGKEEADKSSKRRTAIVNMSEPELAALFKKYGFGGYEKWEAAGKPPLLK